MEGSIDWNPSALELNFMITDGDAGLPVVYEGAIPDAFAAEKDIVVEGVYNPDGVFHATDILLKCPSEVSIIHV